MGSSIGRALLLQSKGYQFKSDLIYLQMFKDYNNLNYKKNYYFFNIFDSFRSHKQPNIKKIVISLNSINCLESRKNLGQNSRIDESFNVKVMSLLKVFEPKNLVFERDQNNISGYFCRVTINGKEEIWSLVKSMVYEHNVLKRIDDDSSVQISHINRDLQKVTIRIPIVDFKDLSFYSLSSIKDFEIKTIFLVFDFYVSF